VAPNGLENVRRWRRSTKVAAQLRSSGQFEDVGQCDGGVDLVPATAKALEGDHKDGRCTPEPHQLLTALLVALIALPLAHGFGQHIGTEAIAEVDLVN